MSQKMDCKITYVFFSNNYLHKNCEYHLYRALVFTKYFCINNLLSLIRGRNYYEDSEAWRGEVSHASVQSWRVLGVWCVSRALLPPLPQPSSPQLHHTLPWSRLHAHSLLICCKHPHSPTKVFSPWKGPVSSFIFLYLSLLKPALSWLSLGKGLIIYFIPSY